MVTLIGHDAKSLIGVDYAATWNGIHELIHDMECAQKGPSNAYINKVSIKKFKENVINDVAGKKALQIADAFRDRIPELKKPEKTKKKVWSDDDGDLNVERYIDGEEKCWRKIIRPKRPNRSLRLMAEISSTGFSTDDELFTRCSTIIAIASWLEDAGYGVEVLAADYSVGFSACNKDEIGTVVVKQASESLDAGNLAGILCSQDFGYNILLKGIVHVCPVEVDMCWGWVKPIPKTVLQSMGVDISVPRNVMYKEQADEWLKKTVKLIEAGE